MTDTLPKTVRFAPSPTGRLHIGNIRTALYNALLALKSGGTLVLRLDDTDTVRSTQEFADFIIEDLAWLNIVADRTERQSERISLYEDAAQTLRRSGHLYPCYETADEIERRRKRLMARGLPPVYDRAALKLDEAERTELEQAGRKPHWRFLLPNFETSPFDTRRTDVHFDDIIRGRQTVDLASMSDPVLIRADGSFLYTLPSVVDDIEMGITHIVRGADHVTNSGAQIALFQALGSEAPVFGHHNLLQDAAGAGLSKRSGALSIGRLRDEGILPMAVASLAALVGTGQPVEACRSLENLARLLDFSGISKSDARFDINELRSLNQKMIHSMDYEDAAPALKDVEADLGEAFWLAVRENVETISQAAEWRDVVEGRFDPVEMAPDDRAFVAQAATLLPPAPWGQDVWREWTGAVKEATGRKGRALYMPLRKVLTGLEHGPDLGQLLPIIGWERTSRRLP